MPLTLAQVGEENVIRRIGGNPAVKQHLQRLGVVVGGNVTVLTALGGSVIVRVRDARIAVSREMAQKILI